MLNTHNTGIDLSTGASSGSSKVKVKGELTKAHMAQNVLSSIPGG